MVGKFDFSQVQIWPISNLLGLRQQRAIEEAKGELPEPTFGKEVSALPTGFFDIVNRWTKMMIPILLMVYLTEQIYPLAQQMEDAKEWDFTWNGWIAKIFVRDYTFNLAMILGWFYWINYSKANVQDMQPLKFEYFFPKQPETLTREVPYTLCTIFMGFIVEVAALRLYAKGVIPESKYYTDFFNWDDAWWTFFWIGLLPSWRDGHFWWIHRAMHPWNTKYVPDIGQILFDYGHYLHHMSKNVVVWSGISMHPIEGFIYETAALTPLLFYHHPLLIWIVKLHLTLAAILGHDGYEFPGAGDWVHYIHHQRFHTNFGSSNAPFDWLFGTFDPGKEDWLKLMAERKERMDNTPGQTPGRKAKKE